MGAPGRSVASGSTYVHAAPRAVLSFGALTRAVAPVADSATPAPKTGLEPATSGGKRFGPCCSYVEPARLKSHAAPRYELSPLPPTSAVLPSAESAISPPEAGPCGGVRRGHLRPTCVHVEPDRANCQKPPAPASREAPISARFPSADSARPAANRGKLPDRRHGQLRPLLAPRPTRACEDPGGAGR